mmetsp:Transcript_34450/g.51402  ORF Transcript_34450/g.51402 Transcript_34450/m.51402 type:complete len:80 (+) Transcript_34450:1845-2084(+)
MLLLSSSSIIRLLCCFYWREGDSFYHWCISIYVSNQDPKMGVAVSRGFTSDDCNNHFVMKPVKLEWWLFLRNFCMLPFQ